MAKWSPTTLLRELEDFQESEGWKDEDNLETIKLALRDRIASDALRVSRERREKQKETLPYGGPDGKAAEDSLA